MAIIFIISLVVAFASLLTLSTSLDDNNGHPSPPVIKFAPVYGVDGEFIVNVSIGTPPSNYPLRLDTDGDLIITGTCEKSSTSFSQLSCSSRRCKAATTIPCNNKSNSCEYEYQYSANSTVQVDLDTETFTFRDHFKVSNLVFACGGVPESNGLGGLGLGRGPLSLISQLNATSFSYCLPSYDTPNKTGVVMVGSRIKTKGKTVIAHFAKSLTKKPSHHYIEFEGISVGNVRLDINSSDFAVDPISGDGGVVVDTGSTLTYLNQGVYDKVAEEVKNQLSIATTYAHDHGDIELPPSLCFVVKQNLEKTFVYPNVTFHFNKWNSLTLAVGNTYREYVIPGTTQYFSCLAMAAALPSDHGVSSLGNILQQNTLVVFDLVKRTVAFTPNAPCDQM